MLTLVGLRWVSVKPETKIRSFGEPGIPVSGYFLMAKRTAFVSKTHSLYWFVRLI